MPVSTSTTELFKKPAAVNIQNALENIDAAKKRKHEIMAEVDQELANSNITE